MAEFDNTARGIDKDGRQPPVKIEVFPLDTDRRYNGGKPFTIERFLSYSFSSNILIPVDTFSFSFRPAPPVQKRPDTYLTAYLREGDTVQLTVDGEAISTGYIDAVASETDAESGMVLQLNGRDLMGFLEDNDAVNPDATILWTNATNINDVMPQLLRNTRIRGFELRNVPKNITGLFATTPGESKLAALQRFIDPLNGICFMNAGGKIVIARPDFDSPSLGQLGISVFERVSNVLRMRVQRASGQIPNAVLSIWTGLEVAQGTTAISKKQLKINQASGPNRLYKAGHFIYRTIATSAPDANDVKSGLNEAQKLISQGANYLDNLAARELAKENVNELIVTCTVPGHVNAQGDPYVPDTCYNIVHDAEGVDEKMYLFSVEYALSENAGQVTHLSFCKTNTIVAQGPT